MPELRRDGLSGLAASQGQGLQGLARPRGGQGDIDAEPGSAATDSPLTRLVVVLHEPQDLVNIALVVRAMKNMGLSRLRLVQPVEFNPYRIEGIAHDTADVVEAAEIFDTLEEAIAGTVRTIGTSARRRSSKQVWRLPADAGAAIIGLTRFGDVALLFGPEHRGLANEQLDRCDEVIGIPTDPDHSSLNLAHAVLLICYEIRKAALEEGLAEGPDVRQKPRHRFPPATNDQMAIFFEKWLEALNKVGFLDYSDETAKMRSFRAIYRRAGLDQREVRLMTAVAHEFLHYERRLRVRLREELGPTE